MIKKITPVKERDGYENGITCLSIIFTYYGYPNVRDKLRYATHSYCSMATSVLQLKIIAEKMGFESTAYKIRDKKNLDYPIFNEDDLPCIVYCNDSNKKRNSFLVIHKESYGYVSLIDTHKGKIRLNYSEFLNIWEDIVLTVKPTKNTFATEYAVDLLKNKLEKISHPLIQPDHYQNIINHHKFNSGNKNEILDLIIIGAGPSGIACAVKAKESGLSQKIFDKGKTLNSLRKFPDEMHFVSEAEDFSVENIPLINSSEKYVTTKQLVNYYNYVVDYFQLPIYYDEKIIDVTEQDSVFYVKTTKETYLSLNIIIATGGDQGRQFHVSGDNLKKVSRSFTYPYNNARQYSNQQLAIIGGGISSVSLATKLCQYDAQVTIIHHSSQLKWTVKPVLDTFFSKAKDYIKENKLTIMYNVELFKIEDNSINVRNIITKEEFILENKYVFLMIGTEPSNKLLKTLNVNIDSECPFPIFDPNTLETNIQGVFVAGSALGQAVFRHFNNHALKIITEIKKRLYHSE